MQLSPGSRIWADAPLHPFPTTANRPVSPVRETDPRLNAATPSFLTTKVVTGPAPDLISREPKSFDAGVIVGGSTIPVPESDAITGSALTSLTSWSCASTGPTTPGSNLTLTEQGWPLVIVELEQESEAISKYCAPVPVRVACSRAICRDCAVLKVKCWAWPGPSPSSAEAKVWLTGETDGTGPGGRWCSDETVARSVVARAVFSAPWARPPPGPLKYVIRLTEKLLAGSDGVESQGSELCMFPPSEICLIIRPLEP